MTALTTPAGVSPHTMFLSKWAICGIIISVLSLPDTSAYNDIGYVKIMAEALAAMRRFSNETVTRKWVDAVGGAFNGGDGAREMWFSALEANDVNWPGLTPACYNATLVVLDAAQNKKEKWALRMVDAWSKPGSGIYQGNLLWPGSYTECVTLEEKFTLAGDVHGKHCLVYVKNVSDPMPSPEEMEALPTGLHIGACIPDVCTLNDSMWFVHLALAPAQQYIPGFEPALSYCRTSGHPPLDAAAVGVISMLCVIGTILLIATFYDVIVIRRLIRLPTTRENMEVHVIDEDTGAGDANEPSTENSVHTYTSFGKHDDNTVLAAMEGHKGWFAMVCIRLSMYTNAQNLLSTKKNPGSLDCVHGIRFLSLTWVILGHTYTLPVAIIINLKEMIDSFRRFAPQVFLTATVSVDTFFLLSGTLLSYLLLKQLRINEGPRHTNWGKFYFHRFWRLTPPYMILLGINTALSRYFAEGPFWPETDGLDPTCVDSWWANLLYINNLVPNHEYCFGWAWYLANDMQFFVISPIFVVTLYLNKIVGVLLCLLTIFGSAIAKGVVLYITHCEAEYAQVLDGATCGETQTFDNYTKPWYRIGPYVVGILLGYVLFKTDRKVYMKWYVALAGWVIAIVSALSIIYGLYGAALGHPLSYAANAIYGALERPVWGAAVAWVIFACVCGYGGPVNKLLSWAPFLPLSRLTFMAYLIHPIVIVTYYNSRKTPVYFSNASMVVDFLGILTMSYGLAFVGSLALESPMMGLEKVVFRKKRD